METPLPGGSQGQEFLVNPASLELDEFDLDGGEEAEGLEHELALEKARFDEIAWIHRHAR